jgi:predicted dehydrogenase
MIHAAVIGLGVIGEVHVSAIKSLENTRLIAVCDTDVSKRELVPPGAAFYADFDEFLHKETPNVKEPLAAQAKVVHICLPHFLHYPVAKKAAEAGFNIFAEKPLAMNAKEGEAYCKLEKQFNVKICLCLQNRLNTTNETLYGILRGGEYGKIIGVRGSVAWHRSKEYYEAGPWRGIMAEAGGGCMINQAIHTMDLMQYFVGSPMVCIKGTIAQVLDYGIEVEDTAVGHIAFENGAQGLFTASVANYTDENVQISIRCEKADFILQDKKLIIIKDNKQEILAADSNEYAGKQVYGSSHAKLIDRFYQALEGKDVPYIHPEEGLPSLRMIDAIRKSSETGKAVFFN